MPIFILNHPVIYQVTLAPTENVSPKVITVEFRLEDFKFKSDFPTSKKAMLLNDYVTSYLLGHEKIDLEK